MAKASSAVTDPARADDDRIAASVDAPLDRWTDEPREEQFGVAAVDRSLGRVIKTCPLSGQQ